MSGAQPYNGVQNFVSFIIGAVGAICMFELNKVFAFMGGFVALPLAVGLITIVMDLFEVGPSITQHVPSIFAGCATFIGILTNNPGEGYGSVFITQIVYLVMGSLFGWMSIAFSEWYSARSDAE